jgi:hypothetical protein
VLFRSYTSAGLLDATHLRFFTLTEIESLLIGAALQPAHTHATCNPSLEGLKIKETGNNLKIDRINIDNLTKEEVVRLFAHTYIVIARK